MGVSCEIAVKMLAGATVLWKFAGGGESTFRVTHSLGYELVLTMSGPQFCFTWAFPLAASVSSWLGGLLLPELAIQESGSYILFMIYSQKSHSITSASFCSLEADHWLTFRGKGISLHFEGRVSKNLWTFFQITTTSKHKEDDNHK